MLRDLIIPQAAASSRALSSGAKLVLGAVLSGAHWESAGDVLYGEPHCFLAEQVGLTSTTVGDHLKALIAAGYLRQVASNRGPAIYAKGARLTDTAAADEIREATR